MTAEDMAREVAKYFLALVDSGVPGAVATALTRDYQTNILIREEQRNIQLMQAPVAGHG